MDVLTCGASYAAVDWIVASVTARARNLANRDALALREMAEEGRAKGDIEALTEVRANAVDIHFS